MSFDSAPLANTPQAKPTIRDVQLVVCEANGVTLAEMKSDCRKRRVSQPRQEAMALARELTGRSYPILGREFCKDHSSCVFAKQKIDRKLAFDADLEARLWRYREEVARIVAQRPPPIPIPPSPPRVRKPNNGQNFRQPPWVEQEVRTLKRLWFLDMTLKEIGNKLPRRSNVAIKSMACRLGLGPRPERASHFDNRFVLDAAA